MNSELALFEQLLAPERDLRSAVSLDERYFGRRPQVAVELHVPSSQLTKVGSALMELDVQARRATSLLRGRGAGTRIIAAPPNVAGLLMEHVEVSSYHGRHLLHGQSLQLSQQHPVAFGLLMAVLANGVSTHLVEPAWGAASGSAQIGPKLQSVDMPGANTDIIVECGNTHVVLNTRDLAIRGSQSADRSSRYRPNNGEVSLTVNAEGCASTVIRFNIHR